MTNSRPDPFRRVSWMIGAILLAGLALPAAADFVVRETTDANQLTLRNLIGEVVVEGHGGRDFEIEVSVQGRDAARDLVRVELLDGSDAILNVRFPLEESSSFVYPRMGRGTSKFSSGYGGNGWMTDLYGRRAKKKLTVSGQGSGLEIWADVTIRVPAGGSLRLRHGVGKISVSDAEDDRIAIDTGSGGIDLRLPADASAEIRAETGSGGIRIDVDGATLRHKDEDSATIVVGGGAADVKLDTGSGAIRIRN